MIFDPNRELEPPLAAAQRRVYQSWLSSLRRPLAEGNPWNQTTWRQLQADSTPQLDSAGNPLLQVKLGDETFDLGLSRSNILRSSAPPELTESILVLRLQEELRNGGSPKASEGDVANDRQLLQEVLLARHRKTEAMEARLTAMRSNTR